MSVETLRDDGRWRSTMDDESKKLLACLVAGDDGAATRIVDRYTRRLLGLARSRLSEKLRRRVDPEDVLQSAYRSFFRRAEQGDFSLRRNGDLWRLLATITVNKTRKRVEYEQAQKRDVRLEENDAATAPSLPFSSKPYENGPTPEEAITLVDEVASVMESLDGRDRRILELRLQDEPLDAIAQCPGIEVSESTVRRVLKNIRDDLIRRLLG
ncbi:MAG: sigma-70 family RNA polymerase sigma factor [Pirellulaceae bacterium]